MGIRLTKNQSQVFIFTYMLEMQKERWFVCFQEWKRLKCCLSEIQQFNIQLLHHEFPLSQQPIP